MTTHRDVLPQVAFWRVLVLRLLYVAIVLGLSRFVWEQLLFDSAQWPAMTGVAKSMMAALVLLCIVAVRYPLDMLPVMIFELVWKAIWMLMIALPAWLNGNWTSSIENLFFECVGVVILLFVIPWRYVWVRWFGRASEPWGMRQHRNRDPASPAT